jgi:SAM-dependent methyltransferase
MLDNKLFPATAMPDADWWQALWPDPVSVLTKSGVKPGMDVVDLCCGNGFFTLPLSSLIESGNLFSLDLDKELLAQAESGSNDENCKNVEFIFADAVDLLDHLSDRVDMVFMANTFHGVPDKFALSEVINQALNSAGRFVIVNWHKIPREETRVLDQARGPDFELRMSPEDVQKIVKPAGFLLDEVVDVGPYHYAAIFSKR